MTLMKVKFSKYDTDETFFKYLWKTGKNVLLKYFFYLKSVIRVHFVWEMYLSFVLFQRGTVNICKSIIGPVLTDSGS